MVIITSINIIMIESFFVEIGMIRSFNHSMEWAYKYLFGISIGIAKYHKIVTD
jgi:hypothetical protein